MFPTKYSYAATMRLGLILFCVLFVGFGSAKQPDEKVVLVSPVLAPPRGARSKNQDTAKDFPQLTLLATDDHKPDSNAVNEKASAQPVYVKVSPNINYVIS